MGHKKCVAVEIMGHSRKMGYAWINVSLLKKGSHLKIYMCQSWKNKSNLKIVWIGNLGHIWKMSYSWQNGSEWKNVSQVKKISHT